MGREQGWGRRWVRITCEAYCGSRFGSVTVEWVGEGSSGLFSSRHLEPFLGNTSIRMIPVLPEEKHAPLRVEEVTAGGREQRGGSGA